MTGATRNRGRKHNQIADNTDIIVYVTVIIVPVPILWVSTIMEELADIFQAL